MTSSDHKQPLLSKEEILLAPETDYMNEDQLNFFRQMLLDLYESTVTQISEAKQQMSAPKETSDANDLGSLEEQANLALRFINREINLLPKIQAALERIRAGSYGYCLESDEPIGVARLIARPTAEYAAEIKAIKELKEQNYRN